MLCFDTFCYFLINFILLCVTGPALQWHQGAVIVKSPINQNTELQLTLNTKFVDIEFIVYTLYVLIKDEIRKTNSNITNSTCHVMH
jgi:hypothetical protein